jgi:hypothetical protein
LSELDIFRRAFSEREQTGLQHPPSARSSVRHRFLAYIGIWPESAFQASISFFEFSFMSGLVFILENDGIDGRKVPVKLPVNNLNLQYRAYLKIS